MARVVSVNLAVVRTGAWTGRVGGTGIDKRPVPGRVTVGALGLEGDTIADTRNHGGVHQAVYAYAREDAAWWARELDREVPCGSLGENLSTEGIDLNDVVVGERWEVGDAVLEASLPRIPCRVFAGFWDVPDLVTRFTARGRVGTYLRVIRGGQLGADDLITVADRPRHGVTISEVFRALTTEPTLLPRLLDAPELPAAVRDLAVRRLAATTG